jgi:formylglycine-generating enzyme required for sulfatase activity
MNKQIHLNKIAILKIAIVSLFSLSIYFMAFAANTAPYVSNVQAQPRSGTKLVDITYDVEDADGDVLTITVEISDDGGNTFTVPAKTFSGDVGPGIIPGKDKKIVWDAAKDVPNVYGTNYIVKVTASDSGNIILGKDDAQMTMIPAGKFQMGDNFYEGSNDERPVHTVYLDTFYMDKYEVTNKQYAIFLNNYQKNVDAAGHELIDINNSSCLIEKVENLYKPKAGYENHPVIYVSWYGAAAYAQFYGKRLPTEAEWEKSARGGLLGKRYPWGDEISHDKANYTGTVEPDKLNGTSPVGSFPPNGYELYDVAGNVWEWCADEYDSEYYSRSPENNPMGPGNVVIFENNDFINVISRRVLRGGAWTINPYYLRCAVRNNVEPARMYGFVGFRCVQKP